MIFVETSVLVAIMAREHDQHEWVARIAAADSATTSPLVVLECTMRLTTLFAMEPQDIETTLGNLLNELAIETVPIEAADTTLAIGAFARYGKGRGHPARLNLADCLSYACAKRLGAKLLYKGDDFARTDLT